MLPMRYLIHDQALAEAALQSWNHDDRQRGFGEGFRISANAVYPYFHSSTRHFLRISPLSEKAPELVAAELDFVSCMVRRGFPALQPDVTREGHSLILLEHHGEQYNVTSFAAVPGLALSDLELTPQLLKGYGRALAELHGHSAAYVTPDTRRPSYEDIIDWIESSLRRLEDEGRALSEADLLRDAFARLPKDGASFGMIHYDFEPDNVFYDPDTVSFHVIDFDDCHYHWYAMDVIVVMAELSQTGDRALDEERVDLFLHGYRTTRALSEELLAAAEPFRRYRDLYGYTRIARCLNDSLPAPQPEWAVKLRRRLHDLKAKRGARFGQPIL
ncbi:MAG TPA: phosphotransferase [Bacillota bacterium]|nr:phosphotransferase [Bacillota bacterium]